MKKETYTSVGGIDCQFEYVNHSIHDLMFRLQCRVSRVFLSTLECLICTHYPETTVDHAPIHYAQLGHDEPLFDEIYSKRCNPTDRISINYHNWEGEDTIWGRRFKEPLPTTYEEMMGAQA